MESKTGLMSRDSSEGLDAKELASLSDIREEAIATQAATEPKLPKPESETKHHLSSVPFTQWPMGASPSDRQVGQDDAGNPLFEMQFSKNTYSVKRDPDQRTPREKLKAAVATGKNIVLEVIRQYKSGRPNYEKVALEALSLSPPIDSKISKLASAGRSFTYRQSREKMRTEGVSLDNPAFEAVGQIIAATTNLPADRVIRKLDNLSTPVRQDVETWQAISLALGYSKWDVGLIESQTKKPKSNKRKQTKRKQVERKQVKR